MQTETYHIPALLPEAVAALDIKPGGVYIDATFGGGGHSRAILSHLGQDGHLLGFDRDADAYANRIDDPRFIFVHSNFRYIQNFTRYHHFDHADGILADLGVSFHHFDTAQRGFSFRTDGPLDMRMNQAAPKSAADIVESYSKEQLCSIFKLYTDLKKPAAIADAIIAARAKAPVDTTFRLADAVKPVINPRQEKKDLAQVFQALRIETNGEMNDLTAFLNATLKVLRPGGILAILTYHSIEDRMVKNFMKTGNTDGIMEKDFFGNTISPWQVLTRKPIEPSEAEIEANPRARSAKLRVARLLPTS